MAYAYFNQASRNRERLQMRAADIRQEQSMSEPKQFLPGVWVEQKDRPFWKLNVQCANAQKLIEFIKANTDERGRIHFCITELRQPKERQTHSMWLDTWRPDARGHFNAAREETNRAGRQSQFADVPDPKAPCSDPSEVPF